MTKFFARSLVGLTAPFETTPNERDHAEHSGDVSDE